MPSHRSGSPTQGTDATASRLLDVAKGAGFPYRIKGMSAYASRSPSHAWAVFDTTRGCIVAYIRDADQTAQWFRDAKEAHQCFLGVSRGVLAAIRGEEVPTVGDVRER